MRFQAPRCGSSPAAGPPRQLHSRTRCPWRPGCRQVWQGGIGAGLHARRCTLTTGTWCRQGRPAPQATHVQHACKGCRSFAGQSSRTLPLLMSEGTAGTPHLLVSAHCTGLRINRFVWTCHASTAALTAGTRVQGRAGLRNPPPPASCTRSLHYPATRHLTRAGRPQALDVHHTAQTQGPLSAACKAFVMIQVWRGLSQGFCDHGSVGPDTPRRAAPARWRVGRSAWRGCRQHTQAAAHT